jgi:hypothetical protein
MERLAEIITDFFNSIGQNRSFGDAGSMSGLSPQADLSASYDMWHECHGCHWHQNLIAQPGTACQIEFRLIQLVLSRAAFVLPRATRSAISPMRASSCSSFCVSRHARIKCKETPT